jgi:hypothetical protein
MTFYYSKDESASVADMSCYDWNSANSTIAFDELLVKKDDNYYYLFANCQSFSNCKKSKDDSWKFQKDTKVRIKLARVSYEKTDFKTKQKTTVQPSRLEKILIALFDEKDSENRVFSGTLSLSDTPMLDNILSGKDNVGTPLPAVVLNSYKQLIGTLLESSLDTKKHFKDDELVAPKARTFGGAKTQTHLEKLNDKLTFIKMQLLAKYPALTIDSYYDITHDGFELQSVPEEIKAKAYQYTLELMTFAAL